MEPDRLDVSTAELDALVDRARPALDEAGYQKLKAAVRTLGVVTAMLENQETTLQSLRNLLCSAQTEKTAEVLKRAGIRPEKTPAAPKPKAPGHGRHAAKAYRGAAKVRVSHASLKPGDRCPECQRGKVYLQHEPGVLIRLIGRAPIEATVYELEKLRCNLCGEVFTAKVPDGIGARSTM
jgi:transposase